MRKLSLILTFALLCACTNKNSLSKHQLYVFGTVVEINVWHEDVQHVNQVINHISNKLNEMHHHWHAWKPGRLHQINQTLRAGKPVDLTIEEASFINRTIQISKQSGHLFNPTIGELINLWGFHSDEYPILTAPPSHQQIDQLLKHSITVNDLKLTEQQLSSDNPHIWLDFGGIAKGYAIDLAVDILRQSNIQNAIINAGGDLYSIGNKGNSPWRVAIQSPKDWTLLAELSVKQDEAIFTSGNYQRYKEFDGKRFAHIIDPRKGMPVDQIVSATVISDNGVLADAAATALVVAGEDWLIVADKLNINQALVVDESHQCFATTAMFKRLENTTIDCHIVD